MNLQTAADVPLIVTVPASTSNINSSASSSSDSPRPQLQAERRINPSWTISQLKAKLEPVTGIPPGSQQLRIQAVDGSWIPIIASDDVRQIGDWGLRRGGEIEVHDSRPLPQRLDHLYRPITSSSSSNNDKTTDQQPEKYTMPTSQYEQLPNSVLAWKRRQKLGRFDPNSHNNKAQTGEEEEEKTKERSARDRAVIEWKGVKVRKRCRVGGNGDSDGDSDGGRRGRIRFVGEIDGLGGDKERGACWVGVELDEPVGKNDGSVVITVPATTINTSNAVPVEATDDDKDDEHAADAAVARPKETTMQQQGQKSKRVRLFECKAGFGLLVRPDKVEAGDQWVPLDDLEPDEDMEEL